MNILDNNLKNILLAPFNILYKIKPEWALKSLFYLKQGHRLDLEKPKTFNEKINWLKLNYRNALMPICADKYTVRQYVKDCGYEDILNDLLWEGFDPEEIPFAELPNQFVIKVTHGSGQNIFCKSKDELDVTKTKKQLRKWLKEKYLLSYGEWFYGVQRPRIIIEKFLLNENNEIPKDYKLSCFNNINGKHDVGFIAIDLDRFGDQQRNIYSRDWDFMPDVNLTQPNNPSIITKKPRQYGKMIEIAKNLSKPFPHARIDLYVIYNKIYFGEITFTAAAGFGNITPRKFHEKIGRWIKLPNVKN